MPALQMPPLPPRRCLSTPSLPTRPAKAMPSLPRGQMLPARDFEFHLTPGSTPVSATLESAACSSRNFVRFSIDPPPEIDITPYAAVYGTHPNSFHFDEVGARVPTPPSSCRVRHHHQQPLSSGNLPPLHRMARECVSLPAPQTPPPSPRGDDTRKAVRDGAKTSDVCSETAVSRPESRRSRTPPHLQTFASLAATVGGSKESDRELGIFLAASAMAPPRFLQQQSLRPLCLD
eukprot:TRINITY_DN103944_c0_g1_i1.p1 TRINITY_DN103944_c0_g1~~TRINITY_DN103944_c0_g1_i1.p1  ORF type:complete len:233 (-),score=17.60 TRINITY_DN103944_c0_g1_i1:38-736(-)